jgi:hypothetical protein
VVAGPPQPQLRALPVAGSEPDSLGLRNGSSAVVPAAEVREAAVEARTRAAGSAKLAYPADLAVPVDSAEQRSRHIQEGVGRTKSGLVAEKRGLA